MMARNGTKSDQTPYSASSPDHLIELRTLILGPEQERLQKLHQHLNDRDLQVQRVSDVLPDAILARGRPDSSLVRALQPNVEEIIRVSVEKDPHVLVRALFPVIGPAIRKAIGAALRGMIHSFNETLERSLSLQGIRWRWEAFRTGRPFAEVVLLHTLKYRVEQVFLIHRESGLLLQHLSEETSLIRDPSLVSAMLNAIQSFVQDSFQVLDDTLEDLRVGDFNIWIEAGPDVVVAAAFRGNAPESYRGILVEAVEQIQLRFGHELQAFEGETGSLDDCRADLEQCLRSERNPDRASTSLPVYVRAAIVFIPLLLLGFWVGTYLYMSLKWGTFLDRLQQEPGLVITSSGTGAGKYQVAGLRDPLAVEPASLLIAYGLSADQVVWHLEPYDSHLPEFVLKRAAHLLAPPADVILRMEGATLFAQGKAPVDWIQESSRLARFLPGVSEFNTEELVIGDAGGLQEIKERIEATWLLFPPGGSQLRDDQSARVQSLIGDLKELFRLASETALQIEIGIRGHTDETGPEILNDQLREMRAGSVLSLLTESGLDQSRLVILPSDWDGSAGASMARELKRSVTFEVLEE